MGPRKGAPGPTEHPSSWPFLAPMGGAGWGSSRLPRGVQVAQSSVSLPRSAGVEAAELPGGGSCILVKACTEAGPAEPGAEGRRESLLGGSLLCPDKRSAGRLPRGVEGSKRPRHLRGTSPMLRVGRVKGEGGPWRPASREKHSTRRNPGDGSCSRASHLPLRRGFPFEEIKGPGEAPVMISPTGGRRGGDGVSSV